MFQYRKYVDTIIKQESFIVSKLDTAIYISDARTYGRGAYASGYYAQDTMQVDPTQLFSGHNLQPGVEGPVDQSGAVFTRQHPGVGLKELLLYISVAQAITGHQNIYLNRIQQYLTGMQSLFIRASIPSSMRGHTNAFVHASFGLMHQAQPIWIPTRQQLVARQGMSITSYRASATGVQVIWARGSQQLEAAQLIWLQQPGRTMGYTRIYVIS